MFGSHSECGLHLTGGDNRIGGDDAQHGGQLRGNHARALDHAADLPAVGAGQFDRLRLGVGGHDGVGGVGAGFGGGGKSSWALLAPASTLSNGSSSPMRPVEQTATSFGSAPMSRRPFPRWRRTGRNRPRRCRRWHRRSSRINGLDVTVGDDLTAPLHRGGTETVRGEHACSRVERAVVDHEGQVLLAFDG